MKWRSRAFWMVVGVLAIQQPAQALQPDGRFEHGNSGSIEVVVTVPGSGGSQPGAGPGSGVEPPVTVVVPVVYLLDDPDWCTTTRTVRVPAHLTIDQVVAEATFDYFATYERRDPTRWVGTCPTTVTEPAVHLTLADLTAILHDHLPRPLPELPPGHALTGLPTSLLTHRPLTYTNVTTVDHHGTAVVLDLDATATYTVDWGDGTTTGPHAHPGRPWPDGTVTHTYTHTGERTIAITDTWTVHWRLAGHPWNPPVTVPLDPTTMTVPVRQLQAIRTW